MTCYNMKRQQPRIFMPDFKLVENKPLWYQCMMCNASEYVPKYKIDAPSSTVCKSTMCRIDFALLYSTTEDQFKENLEEIMKMESK